MPTPTQIEAAARALAKAAGDIPDFPVGVSREGWWQEPHVKTVPLWQWKYERLATDVLTAAEAAGADAVAWIFELASTHNISTGEYSDWKECIQVQRPVVPPGSIRNLRPLYAGVPLPQPPGEKE